MDQQLINGLVAINRLDQYSDSGIQRMGNNLYVEFQYQGDAESLYKLVTIFGTDVEVIDNGHIILTVGSDRYSLLKGDTFRFLLTSWEE